MARTTTTTTIYCLIALVILIITPFPLSVNGAGGTKNYIVTLKTASDTEAHLTWVKQQQNKKTVRMNTDEAQTADDTYLKTFSIGSLNGYSGVLDESWTQNVLSKRSEVASVETNGEVKVLTPVRKRQEDNAEDAKNGKNAADLVVAKNPQINIDMMDTNGDQLFDNSFTSPKGAGEGVNVFVVDTGVRATHTQFEGRAKMAKAICAGCPNTDDNGHGTHVSGIVAGKTFGVAKKANILGIKVLDAKGAGKNDDVIAGLQFVEDAKKADDGKGIFVVNMSLGGTKNTAVNDAVKALTDSGVHVFVAAGNEAQDACNTSPASELSAVTVGAVEDLSLTITDFSNFGKCVDLFAPGRDIQSCGIQNDDDTAVFSGTSQATPHVAGAAALVLSEAGDMSAAALSAFMTGNGLKGKMTFLAGTETGSPNTFASIRGYF